ncbi:MAG: glutaredoxin family protein [Candidatus Bipolaricaulota bacterium]
MSDDHEVVIYSTPACPYCSAAKDYFRDHEIDFTNHDVSEDREKAMEMINKTGQQGVPVIEVDGETIVGFDKDRIEELLN